MQPLIPPEQEEQYRKLQEQAQKHAKKQLRRQQQREMGEPVSSSSDSEEEVEAVSDATADLEAQRELAEMEAAALAAGEDTGDEVHTTVLALPAAAQSPLLQPHPAMLISPQTMAPSLSLGGTPHMLHAAPGHPQLLVPASHAQVSYWTRVTSDSFYFNCIKKVHAVDTVVLMKYVC